MTRGELLNFLTERAREFRKDRTVISRNYHISGLKEDPSQEVIDAVLVCFINYVGEHQGVDYALYTSDL